MFLGILKASSLGLQFIDTTTRLYTTLALFDLHNFLKSFMLDGNVRIKGWLPLLLRFDDKNLPQASHLQWMRVIVWLLIS